MSNATKVLSQLAYLEIFKPQTETAIDIKGWLANQRYYVAPGMTSTNFTLNTQDSKGLSAALGNDCNRMSMAAIESICGVKADLIFPNSSAWATIRSYYASFFAAHALLKVFGYSYSQLEIGHTNKIFEMARATNVQGGHSNIQSGFYSIHIDKLFKTLTFEKKQDSHKGMWKGFLTLINQLYVDIDSTSALGVHKLNAMEFLEETRRCVTKNGTRYVGNWLSELRNQVNYQHLHGTWFPYERGVVGQHIVNAAHSKWRDPSHTFHPLSKQRDLELFFESTALLLSFLREMLCICSEKVGNKGSAFQNGALRMLRTIKVT